MRSGSQQGRARKAWQQRAMTPERPQVEGLKQVQEQLSARPALAQSLEGSEQELGWIRQPELGRVQQPELQGQQAQGEE